jgi:hypothetical protein
LDWVAVDHWNTDNPHVHVLIRKSAAASVAALTDVALQEGEQLVGSGPVAAGDTVRWIIGDTESGAGPCVPARTVRLAKSASIS